MFKKSIIAISILLSACLGVPEDITPVQKFDLNKYLGKWYEIARLDHSFERGLQNVTAEYSIRNDGGIKVINSGFSIKENEWKSAEGKAYFVNNEDEGYLKVSFFGPFYGSYVIFELDEDYQYAFVTGADKTYLWLLSRTPNIDNKLKDHFIEKVSMLGYDTSEIIFVTQN
jgi:apolipoprotein D and lipocalin family protein